MDLQHPGYNFNSHNLQRSKGEDLWRPNYGDYRLDVQIARLDDYIKSIDTDLEPDDIERSYSFIERAFGEYNGDIAITRPGSFGFIVPTRIKRLPKGQKDDYSSEIDTLIPVLRNADAATKQAFMSGMCPFVIDRYRPDEKGRSGAMIYAPILTDMKHDLPPFEAASVIKKAINDTVDFAQQKLGIDTVGLGAILPRVTDFGRIIENTEVTVTTGHAATVWLICQTLIRAKERNFSQTGNRHDVGIIGTGAIGAATAALILEMGISSSILLSDINTKRADMIIDKLSKEYPGAKLDFTTNNHQLVATTNTTIGAVSTHFAISKDGWEKVSFEGVHIIDDSQPGAFSPDDVLSRGGRVEWPIGVDTSSLRSGAQESFKYGGEGESHSGPASAHEVFGCEGEAIGIYRSGRQDSAVRREVQPQDALSIGGILKATGISLADPQSMGQKLNI